MGHDRVGEWMRVFDNCVLSLWFPVPHRPRCLAIVACLALYQQEADHMDEKEVDDLIHFAQDLDYEKCCVPLATFVFGCLLKH